MKPDLRVIDKSGRIPVAVLGDSDSHCYRDHFDKLARGGEYHSVTFNWTEIWQMLRANEIDQGEFGKWGTHFRIARVMHRLGCLARAPRKLDFKYNYALSGVRCESLLDSWPYQGRWLLRYLQRNPIAWHNGVVIIRIGINDFGQIHHLNNFEQSGLDKAIATKVDRCVAAIEAIMNAILSACEGIKVVLVGIARDYYRADIMANLSNQKLENIESVLSYFDKQLVFLSDASPRVMFVDDFAWWHRYFQFKVGDARPNDKTTLSDGFELYSAIGDAPHNVTLSDGHAGTVSNGLWLMHLVDSLRAQWGLNLTPIKDTELTRIVRQHSSSAVI
ncbi:MAG: hypothetical protein MI976_05535 [Pseudomonadales bacterium]|nr:hypothetical protein [Pseudomonadales bacterium]